jgi:hypothetical protein
MCSRCLALALVSLTLCACGEARTGSVSSAAVSAMSAPLAASAAPSAAPSASAAGPQAKAGAGAAPTMPAQIASCEPGGAHFGGYVPTVDDLRLAVGVRDDEACLPDEVAADAIGACAAKLGATSLKISTDRFEGTPKGCEVSIAGAEAKGRKWIVLRSAFRDGTRFYGTTKVVELTNGGPKLYLDATGEHEAICAEVGGPKRPSNEGLGPDGWSGHDEALRRFFCERAGGG